MSRHDVFECNELNGLVDVNVDWLNEKMKFALDSRCLGERVIDYEYQVDSLRCVLTLILLVDDVSFVIYEPSFLNAIKKKGWNMKLLKQRWDPGNEDSVETL